VRTSDGRLLVRSRATRHVLARLGGPWRALGALLGVVPRPLAAGAYDRVASVRKSLFAKPATACPLVPRELAGRFEP